MQNMVSVNRSQRGIPAPGIAAGDNSIWPWWLLDLLLTVCVLDLIQEAHWCKSIYL